MGPESTKIIFDDFIQSEGLVCNHDAVVYVIAKGVCYYAIACIFKLSAENSFLFK